MNTQKIPAKIFSQDVGDFRTAALLAIMHAVEHGDVLKITYKSGRSDSTQCRKIRVSHTEGPSDAVWTVVGHDERGKVHYIEDDFQFEMQDSRDVIRGVGTVQMIHHIPSEEFPGENPESAEIFAPENPDQEA